MRSVEWRRNIVPCMRERQCAPWSGVETCLFLSAECNALRGVTWKRGSLHPRRVMSSVEWRVTEFPCIRGELGAWWRGVETWFLVSTEGNALGEVAWNRGTLYPRGQWARCSGVETWFLVSAEGNALVGVAWKHGSFYARRAMRSALWRGNVVPSIRRDKCSRWRSVETFPSILGGQGFRYAEGKTIG